MKPDPRLLRLRRGKTWAWVLGSLVGIAILADVLAYSKPLLASLNGEIYSPLLNDLLHQLGLYAWSRELVNANWKELNLDWVLWPPVAWGPGEIDVSATYATAADARFGHPLGTDRLGRDVLANLLHGTRLSLGVGVLAAMVALCVGVVLGALAGFMGNRNLLVPRWKQWALGLGGVVALTYAIAFPAETVVSSGEPALMSLFLLRAALFAAVMSLFWVVFWLLSKTRWGQKPAAVPLDGMVQRLIELLQSLPVLLLLFSLAAVLQPNIWRTMLLIGLLSWTRTARLTRAELLRIGQLEYVLAARSLGLSQVRILFLHALPNGLAPALVSGAFAVSAGIMIESTLSFFNLGVAPETLTWGKMLSLSLHDTSNLWLVVGPGLAIFSTVLGFNLLADDLQRRLAPHQH